MEFNKSNNEIIIYEGDNGQPKLEMRLENEMDKILASFKFLVGSN